jgi:hypothetical protein
MIKFMFKLALNDINVGVDSVTQITSSNGEADILSNDLIATGKFY